jgi:hypothetical protein
VHRDDLAGRVAGSPQVVNVSGMHQPEFLEPIRRYERMTEILHTDPDPKAPPQRLSLQADSVLVQDAISSEQITLLASTSVEGEGPGLKRAD